MSGEYSRDNSGGIYNGTQFHDKTFYGFKLDSVGHLNVEIIRSDDSDTIKLPYTTQAAYVDSAADSLNVTFVHPDDYRSYFWSMDAITFRFNNTTGHLEMVAY